MNKSEQSSQSNEPNDSLRSRLRILALVIGGALVVGIVLKQGFFSAADVSVDELLLEGESALAGREYDQAEQIALRILKRQPDSLPALLLAGRAADAARHPQQAVDYLDQIPDDGSPPAVSARNTAGTLLVQEIHHLAEAQKQFQRAVKQDPANLIANEQLAYLAHTKTSTWESIPHDMSLIRLGAVSRRRLHQIHYSDRLRGNAEFLEQCLQAKPDDPIALVGLASLAIAARNDGQAEEQLRKVVTAAPERIEAQVMLGELLLRTGSDKQFLDWYATVPESGDAHPGIWNIRGAWAFRQGEIEVAARCYWEVAKFDPNHQRAISRLGQTLSRLNRQEDAAPFFERAKKLLGYADKVRSNYSRFPGMPGDGAKMVETARLAESLGLIWESMAWLHLCLEIGPRDMDAGSAYKRLAVQYSDLPLTRAIPSANLAARIDLSTYPLPNWSTGGSKTGVIKTGEIKPLQVVANHISFEDRAEAAGLSFTYFNGSDPDIDGLVYFYEFVGGGAAVLDYDCDGWPDIYLTQGGNKPNRKDSGGHLDRLFRNLGDGRFEDVTAAAGLAEDGYSHGVAAGDVNNDGFPDLYIGNFGPNRLYLNNGDGTFTEMADSTGNDAALWTTSCLMADLNGDSWPEIYTVNYLSGEDVLSRICRDSNQRRNLCLPLEFTAAQDQLFYNLGDGSFEEVTTLSGIENPRGKGLGILAADFDGSGSLNLFIANDGAANFYYVNQAERFGNRPKFSERAMQMGLALDETGWQEGSKGLAVGDVDGNGLVDLLITNSSEEPNRLFRQQPGHLFLDGTQRSGLEDPSFGRHGFGAQYLDADLNGRLDLIVTNGNTDINKRTQTEYEMPPLFFRNFSGGRFSELPAESLGPFFQRRYLGRGMSRLDWNRDGLEDVVISHLDAPVALLTNTTSTAGHFVAVTLRGVVSSRDAIGTVVTLEAGDTKLVRQLTAGDGYLASNQKLLVFGLGEKTQVDNLHVRWPSGITQDFSNIPIDGELLLIEGRVEPIVRAKP